jgi:hypothetical protein
MECDPGVAAKAEASRDADGSPIRKGVRSARQLEKGIDADRATTERLLLAIGARKSEAGEEWTLTPINQT